jgi:hypothetical protein
MKKIKYLMLLVPGLLLTSCAWLLYDNYQKFDDEFRNNKKFIARVIIDPEERRTEINSAYVIFEREVSSDQDNVKAFFVISRSSNSFKIEDQGFLKANDQSFEIKIINTVSEYKSRTETSVKTYAKTDSTGVETGQTTDIDERNWIDDKFMFTLTPEMISEIRKSDVFIVRFYFGPMQATFKFRGSKLNPIHKVLNGGG